MKISFSATNPCHMWPTARAVAQEGALAHYYSGYPAWKIADANPTQLRCSSFRTNVVYGLLKYAPAALRPSARRLFRWQDHGFDRWVGAHLEPCVFLRAEHPSAPPIFRILFAGQISLRKGIRTLLDALTLADRAHWKMEFIGSRSPEAARDIAAYCGATPLTFHGTMPQEQLARAM